MKNRGRFIDQMKPWYGAKEQKAVAEYLRSGGWLMEFKKTEEFERAICEYTGAAYCSVLPNGTVSLVLALMALGITRGDEVIVPDFTMIATPNAVRMVGARPVFVDVDASLCLDPKLVERAITKKTKAVFHVSINGRAGNLASIQKLCKKHRLFLVEDAAQSLGSMYRGTHLGRHGIIGSFSFSAPKIITTGQGGALITDDRKLYGRIEKLKDFGRIGPGIDMHDALGWNFKFTDLQAVFGLAQMQNLPWRVQRKKEIYRLYRRLLAPVREVSFRETELKDVAPWFIDIAVPDPAMLSAYLKERGIGSRAVYPAIHTQAIYRAVRGKFPVALDFATHGLWLPSSLALRDADIRRVCACIKDFYASRD